MTKSFLAVALSLLVMSGARALEMKAVVDGENLAHVFLWGPIELGDDEKFRQLVLPLVKSGNLIWEVNTFSGGGNVHAAMGIGNQIRLLNARTVAPNRFYDRRGGKWIQRSEIQCWFKSSIGGAVFTTQKDIVSRSLKSPKNSWCDCASACFLIWASGVTREGNHIGIHRLKFDPTYFASLSAEEAKLRYKEAELGFRGYLQKLDIPVSLLDRLFATDSRSIYYIAKSELEIINSTPYLEELTEARCPPDKTERIVTRDGWSTKFDINRINCYRGILKEIMKSGVKAYLDKYGN